MRALLVIGSLTVLSLIVIGAWRGKPMLLLLAVVLWVPLMFTNPQVGVLPWSREAVRRAVCDPMPASLKNLRSSFDQSVASGSETVRYRLTFSVSSNDMHRIINAKSFETSHKRALVTNELGWFQPESIGTNDKIFVYERVNRRDFLWVDKTGTNCLYLYEFVKTEYREVSDRR